MLTVEALAQRKGKMTSSVIAGALGHNQHMSPLQAWIAITGRVVDGRHVDTFFLGDATESVHEGDAVNQLRKLEQAREARS